MSERPRDTRSRRRHGFLRLHTATLRRWCWESTLDELRETPALIAPDGAQASGSYLSFFSLIEAGFFAAYRRAGIRSRRVRLAIDVCRRRLGVDRPMPLERFRTDARALVAECDAGLLDAHAVPRNAWPGPVESWLRSVDYDDRGPTQVWIAGREGSILLNPRIGFGVPVLGRSGVRTEEVAARIAAGETKAEIAEDLGVNEAEVTAAMQWETG